MDTTTFTKRYTSYVARDRAYKERSGNGTASRGNVAPQAKNSSEDGQVENR